MLINLQQVRLWLTTFPEGSLVERAECLGCFTMVPFSPPAGSTRGFFSNIPCENQVTLLEVNLRKGSLMTGPPRGSSPSSMTVCPGPGSHGGFCSAKLWLPVAACPAVRCEGSSLPCELTSLTDLRRLTDFRLSSICLLLEWSGGCWLHRGRCEGSYLLLVWRQKEGSWMQCNFRQHTTRDVALTPDAPAVKVGRGSPSWTRHPPK